MNTLIPTGVAARRRSITNGRRALSIAPVLGAIAFGALLLSMTLAGGTLPAQEWRTLEARRNRPDTSQGGVDTLHVRLAYGAGELSFRGVPAPALYDLHVRYDANERRVKYHYDSETHTLTVGGDSGMADIFSLRRHHDRPRDEGSGSHSTLSLGVASGVPLDLALDFSASEATLDMSGLSLSRLSIETAASESRVTFGTVNPSRIPSIELRATAAGFSVEQLGNAHADTVHANATMGRMDLDLSGEWTGDATLDLRAVMSAVTVRIPRDVGVRVRSSTIFGKIDAPGFTERDGVFYSDNFDGAARRVLIDGRAIMAGIEVVRIE